MNLYKVKKQFDPDTGKPTDPTLTKCKNKAICDWSGSELDFGNCEEEVTYTLSIQYNHGSEPNWYENHHKFEADFGITYSSFAEFMESPYHFGNIEEYGCEDVSQLIAAAWLDAREGVKGPKTIPELKEYGTIEGALSFFRLRTLRRLLTEKKYTPEQLGLEIDPQFDPKFNEA